VKTMEDTVCVRKLRHINGFSLREISRQTGLHRDTIKKMRGLVVHGMEGFDYEKARSALGVPDDFTVEAMAAIGRPGDPADLSETLRERERPSMRKALAEIIMEGPFR
jgi:hypothetical protein